MSENLSDEAFWKFLFKKHWLRLIPFILVIFAAFISGIYVFLWHNEIGGYWSYTFDDWSFAGIVVYLFLLALREFLLVALPTLAVFRIIFYIIWFTIAENVRAEIKARGKQKEKKEKLAIHGGKFGRFFGAIIWIVLLIIVAVDGNWETTFANLPLIYFVKTFITAMIWVAIIFRIPATIGIIY